MSLTMIMTCDSGHSSMLLVLRSQGFSGTLILLRFSLKKQKIQLKRKKCDSWDFHKHSSSDPRILKSLNVTFHNICLNV